MGIGDVLLKVIAEPPAAVYTVEWGRVDCGVEHILTLLLNFQRTYNEDRS
jgi:hypothetical protein